MNTAKINTLIEQLGLQPLPLEGGYFRVLYTADERLPAEALPQPYHHARALYGTIYFLETGEQFSAMHSLPTDEIYYYHLGDPVQMLFLYPDGSGETRVLGPDVTGGQSLQLRAVRHCYHGSRPLPDGDEGFALLSTSMAPGFDASDPVFPTRTQLVEKYPQFSSLIKSLTRTQPHNLQD